MGRGRVASLIQEARERSWARSGTDRYRELRRKVRGREGGLDHGGALDAVRKNGDAEASGGKPCSHFTALSVELCTEIANGLHDPGRRNGVPGNVNTKKPLGLVLRETVRDLPRVWSALAEERQDLVLF
jgi:hypothetical protein